MCLWQVNSKSISYGQQGNCSNGLLRPCRRNNSRQWICSSSSLQQIVRILSESVWNVRSFYECGKCMIFLQRKSLSLLQHGKRSCCERKKHVENSFHSKRKTIKTIVFDFRHVIGQTQCFMLISPFQLTKCSSSWILTFCRWALKFHFHRQCYREETLGSRCEDKIPPEFCTIKSELLNKVTTEE
jgi:hypothetical protein